ncbi:MAG: sigma-54-dependent transcriptional regulator [Pseudomonadota bacterium]
MKARVLVVEDDAALLDLLGDELETEGYGVVPADGLARARVALAGADFDLVITDLRLPDGSGQDVLKLLEPLEDRPACLMITAFGSVRDAVAALSDGADDFLTKPLEMDHLLLTVSRLVQQREMRRELERMRGLVKAPSFHGIVGNSRAMQRLGDQIALVARADGPVLVAGESGTGKELVAKAVHQESARAGGPFVAINCAGIPSELIESELFGYEAGAFTGARSRRKGIFQEATGGTLLLDEIGEMPAELQAKLLRVLQEGSIRPVGATGELAVDVRVIAATHRDIRSLVAAGTFREDLYYRLETFMLEVPPLREREEDLELLVTYFLRQHSARLERDIHGIDSTALEALRHYPFPGNVRELSNVVERAVAFSRGPDVTVNDLPDRLTDGISAPGQDVDGLLDDLQSDLPSIEQLQRRYARRVLERTGGNKRRAAAILGVTRGTLYRWLEEES